MANIAAFIWGALAPFLGSLLGRAMVALGFGAVSYTGISITLDWLKSQAVSAIGALGPDVVGMLVRLKVGVFISIIFSALLARMVLNGLSGDKLKKWVTK